jgi:hypothetical protein
MTVAADFPAHCWGPFLADVKSMRIAKRGFRAQQQCRFGLKAAQ